MSRSRVERQFTSMTSACWPSTISQSPVLKGLPISKRDAGDDVAEQILHRKADDADDHRRAEDRALNGVSVDATDDDEDRDDEEHEADELAEKLRRLRLADASRTTAPRSSGGSARG